MADARQCLRNIRIIHFAFLGIPALLFFLLSTLHIAAKAEPTLLPMVLAVLAVSEVGIATAFRGKLIRPALEKLQRSPHDSAALEVWRRGNMLSFVFALTVALYGAVIRVMGFRRNIAAWFLSRDFFCCVVDAADGVAGFQECACSAATDRDRLKSACSSENSLAHLA